MAFEYRDGRRVPRMVKLTSGSAAIVTGDALTITDADDGYFKEVDATTEVPQCIAMQDQSSPTASGDLSVLADFSLESTYEVGPDSGSITQAIAGNTADCGADARTLDINGTAVDCFHILSVDVSANKAIVMLRTPALVGV